MPRECLFDRLPVELLHTLFTYFLAHEILFSFSDVSDYVSSTLLTYSAHRMNFNATQSPIDLIYSGIRPEQVISLTFSDDVHLVELFFNHLRIEEFTQLRSLAMMQSHSERLKSTIRNLHKLERLHFLSFDTETIRACHDGCHANDPLAATLVAMELCYDRGGVMSRLTHSHFDKALRIRDIDLSRMVHLGIAQCFVNELDAILCKAPRLRSLHISLIGHIQDAIFNLPPNRLHRLHLKAKSEQTIKASGDTDHPEHFLLPS